MVVVTMLLEPGTVAPDEGPAVYVHGTVDVTVTVMNVTGRLAALVMPGVDVAGGGPMVTVEPMMLRTSLHWAGQSDTRYVMAVWISSEVAPQAEMHETTSAM